MFGSDLRRKTNFSTEAVSSPLVCLDGHFGVLSNLLLLQLLLLLLKLLQLLLKQLLLKLDLNRSNDGIPGASQVEASAFANQNTANRPVARSDTRRPPQVLH